MGLRNIFGNDNNKVKGDHPDLYALYIPGGGMLGILPAMMLEYMEELTGRPTAELFQIMDGVSTGAILAAGLNIPDDNKPQAPKYSAKDLKELYLKHGPDFFPDRPGRMAKMIVANIANVIEDGIDPTQGDERPILDEIRSTLNDIKNTATPQHEREIKQLEELALKRWLTQRQKTKALELCTNLSKNNATPAIKSAEYLYEFINLRRVRKNLSRVFGKAALGGIKLTKKWANQYMYDPKVPENIFKRYFGEARMNNSLSTLYISTYDLGKDRKKTFFSLKSDYFDNNSSKQKVSKENALLWDAVMASAANNFAFPAHETEDGSVCDDQAIVHTPLRCIHDALYNKKSGQKIKLVVFGTGTFFTKKTDRETLKADHVRLGLPGRFITGRATKNIKNYTMTDAKDMIKRELGKDNIHEFSPRLSPRNSKEHKEFPSKANVLDASDQNLELISNAGKRFLREEGHRLRKLAADLCRNLHKAGKMNNEELEAVLTKIKDADKQARQTYTRECQTPSVCENKISRTSSHDPANEQDNIPQQDNNKAHKKGTSCPHNEQRKGPNRCMGPS